MSSIGEIARDTGTSVQTVRYYEARGLLPKPPRSDGGQRRYTDDHRTRLLFIRHAREMGFSLPDIAEMIDLSSVSGKPCEPVDRMARCQLAEVDRKIARLQALRSALSGMIERCDGEDVSSCRILETLGASSHPEDK
ncbi:helix-turn-helix domain-containing protein [Stappia sp. F7233]|uniref:Helix-turn-helix domain-containing protein n=1 Tax=Stappia albiluteola TaxID=2758565 RepID=A0A839AF92_9HYPH|nr:helix-turn-helix domain-containing protein [Stappia albiluteola]